MKFKLFLLIFLSLLSFSKSKHTLQLNLKQTLIDYIKNVFVRQVQDKLSNLSLDPMHYEGGSSFFEVKVDIKDLTISNVQILEQNTKLELKNDKIIFSSTNLVLEFKANNVNVWTKVYEQHLGLILGTQSVSFYMEINPYIKQNQIQIQVNKGTVDIPKITFEMFGVDDFTQKTLKYIWPIIENDVYGPLSRGISEQLKGTIEEVVNPVLQNLPFEYNIPTTNLTFKYLVEQIQINDDWLQLAVDARISRKQVNFFKQNYFGRQNRKAYIIEDFQLLIQDIFINDLINAQLQSFDLIVDSIKKIVQDYVPQYNYLFNTTFLAAILPEIPEDPEYGYNKSIDVACKIIDPLPFVQIVVEEVDFNVAISCDLLIEGIEKSVLNVNMTLILETDIQLKDKKLSGEINNFQITGFDVKYKKELKDKNNYKDLVELLLNFAFAKVDSQLKQLYYTVPEIVYKYVKGLKFMFKQSQLKLNGFLEWNTFDNLLANLQRKQIPEVQAIVL